MTQSTSLKSRFTVGGKPDTSASQAKLDELEKLSSAYEEKAPPDQTASLNEAISQARNNYQDEKQRNEWLEVAQTLARTVAQYGAAKSGLNSGRDMSNLNMGQAIDYGARTDRAQKQFGSEAGIAKDAAASSRQAFLDKANAAEGTYKAKSGSLQFQAKELGDRESDAAKSGRSAYEFSVRENNENNREKARSSREDLQRQKMEVDENNKEIKDATAKAKAKQDLISSIMQEEDISSPKGREKAQLKYSRLAGEAGIDLTEVMAKLQEAEDKQPGFFSRMGGAKETPKQDISQGLLGHLGLSQDIEKIRALRERNKQLIQGQGGQAAQAPVGSDTTPPLAPPATVKIKGPSGEIAEMTKEKAQKYLGKPGYSEVK